MLAHHLHLCHGFLCATSNLTVVLGENLHFCLKSICSIAPPQQVGDYDGCDEYYRQDYNQGNDAWGES